MFMAVAHSLGGEYNVPHGYANAVILPHGAQRIRFNNYRQTPQAGLFPPVSPKKTRLPEEAAESFISAIEDMKKRFRIERHHSGNSGNGYPQAGPLCG